MHSTHNEGKSVVAQKENLQKYDFNINKAYNDKLANKVNEYNNTYHRTIKMKLTDVTSSAYIDFGIKTNDKDSKSEIGDHVRTLKYKNSFGHSKLV